MNWEKEFLSQQAGTVEMTFREFFELYKCSVIGAIKRYRTEDKEKFKKRKKPTKKLIDKFIVGAVL